MTTGNLRETIKKAVNLLAMEARVLQAPQPYSASYFAIAGSKFTVFPLMSPSTMPTVNLNPTTRSAIIAVIVTSTTTCINIP